MFAKHPLDRVRDRLDEQALADALRLAIIAELDAISFYLQIARASTRDDVRRVFEDVADEERVHVGEFLEMLRRLDPAQASRLEEGYREVLELVGGPQRGGSPAAAPAGGAVEASSRGDPPAGAGGLAAVVSELFGSAVEAVRAAVSLVPVTRVEPGVDYVALSRVAFSEEGVVVESEEPLALRELSVEFLVPRRVADRVRVEGSQALRPIVWYAATLLASREEKLVVEGLLGLEKERSVGMRSWEAPGEAVEDVTKALAEVEKEGVRGRMALLVSPARYARLMKIGERTGMPELKRLEELVDVKRVPSMPDNRAVLVAEDPAYVDLVVAAEPVVEELGPESGGYRFRAWERAALRVSNPSGVLVLTYG